MLFRSSIWQFTSGSNEGDSIAKSHPARFPEKLAQDHILSWSNKGDIVFDPFLGSGTTAKMAILNKRRFIGCDISEEYCQLSRRRVFVNATKEQR